MIRKLDFCAGYDKRPTYGVHGSGLMFSIQDRWGAVTFELDFHFLTPTSVEQDWEPVGKSMWPRKQSRDLSPVSIRQLSVHSAVDLSGEYPWVGPTECMFIPSGCWTTGWSTRYDLLEGLVNKGQDWLFDRLEVHHASFFSAIGTHYSI